MATEAQIAANRRNAEKSTGPRTHAGKAAVSRNAVKHGLFTDAEQLPGEDLAEFQAFASAVVADLQPVGMNQILLAKRIAQVQWKLERIPQIEASVMGDIAGAHRWATDLTPAVIIGREFDVFLRYQLYEQRLERSYRAYMKEFRQLKKETAEESDDADDAAAEAADALDQYLSIVQSDTEDQPEDRAQNAPEDNTSATPVAASEVDSKKQTQSDPNDRPGNDLHRRRELDRGLQASLRVMQREYEADCKKENREPKDAA